MVGSIALVGSGEYLPEMIELERILLNDGLQQGKRATFVQIPTAAAQEGKRSLEYWKELGARQAERLGIEQIFLEVITREDANDATTVKNIQESALVYFSGGNPKYLADTLRDTLLATVTFESWQSGTSVAGCSAGAMALCAEVVGFRFFNSMPTKGLGFVTGIQVLPHYDRYFRYIPEGAVKRLTKDTMQALLIGIDELTALVKRGDQAWHVHGKSNVHILNSEVTQPYSHNDYVTF